MTNSNGKVGVRKLDEHRKWLDRLGESYLDVEHFRVPHHTFITHHLKDGSCRTVPTGYNHVCVVVLKDGRCYIGEARCSPSDQYDRKRGFRMATGRALKEAVLLGHPSPFMEDFRVDMTLTGKELRDECRRMCHEVGVM